MFSEKYHTFGFRAIRVHKNGNFSIHFTCSISGTTQYFVTKTAICYLAEDLNKCDPFAHNSCSTFASCKAANKNYGAILYKLRKMERYLKRSRGLIVLMYAISN